MVEFKLRCGHDTEKTMEGTKVLILERDRRLRLSRTRSLLRDSYQVTGVCSAQKAVEVAKRQPYELLIASVDETELLNMLLTQFPPELTVLIITPEDMVSKIVENSGTGIHSFLIEPFSLNEFKDAVARTIDRARLVSEGFRSKTLMALEQMNRLLASEVEINKLFKLVVEISAASTKADFVSLLIKDAITKKFTIKAQIGDHEPAWNKICQQMTKMGKPILLDEATRSHSCLYKAMTEAGISAMLCMPLVVGEDVIGAINHIKIIKRARFTSGDMNFTSILGRWNSIALENARLFNNYQSQHLHLEKLLHEISLAQENERRRVAAEIHDSAVQWMIGAFYRIKASRALISESRFGDLGFELTKIEKTLQRSIKELRRVMANLHPFALEKLGLVAALQKTAQALNEEGIRCRIEVDEMLPRLTFAEESATYRIVQEALTNIMKHSEATEVCLCLRFYDNTVSVEVSDNGWGFDPNRVMSSKIPLQHMGLTGMKERVELLGGYLSINSKPGKGTSVGFTFPVISRLTMKTKTWR